MKKILLVISTIVYSLFSFAQRPTATIQQVSDFVQNATLYVILDENPMNDYNAEIRKAVEKNWKLNSFKFIHQNDMTEKMSNAKNAFLIPVIEQFSGDKDTTQYLFLSILIGGEYETVNDLPEICTFPLCYAEDDESSMTYKLPAIVAFFNKHVQNILDNPKLLKDKKFATYTKQKRSLSGKTIYLIQSEQATIYDEIAEIQAIVPNLSVSIEEEIDVIEKNIRRKEANTAFIHVVGPTDKDMLPGRCYTAVMDTDGNLYYFAYHTITTSAPNGMTTKDWKILSKFPR